ncbi:hypothetical protein [Loktanella sp. S4079]|uniref:hypothetical protein n=1 Tax=Loktanella sp. S4079 TaxID=579483 RepID=UPI0005FA8821|nr:hypothetical protein [Loktanella sp. S4079]KJZ17928.1 hypothetical protein TW80_16465 [Loktanella sp. S4079]
MMLKVGTGYMVDDLDGHDELTLLGIEALIEHMERIAFSLVRQGKSGAALDLFSSVAALHKLDSERYDTKESQLLELAT